MVFHEKEKNTVYPLLAYLEQPESWAICRLVDNSLVKVELLSAFEDDNEDYEGYENESYDEFFTIGLKILEILEQGSNEHHVGEWISVWYRNFPTEIIGMNGEIIYKESSF